MQRHILILITCLLAVVAPAQNKVQKSVPTIYVDAGGVMRWSDTKKEASFFGVNYTLPFAHAYRAMGYLGVDRKAAIDRDVYHMARLGLNAYRIHIWDVEISDAEGNLQENEHLELLDYLIHKLQERGIRTVITAQTNFGNGYPERNQPTGGFSSHYDKCAVHSDVGAIAAQEKYIADLVNDKKIEGISNANDESDRDGMRIVIDIKRDANASVVLNKLYKMTALQTSFGVNNVALVHGRPKTLNLRDLIKYFIEHRHEVVIRRTQFDLRKAKERAHILEGLIIASDNIDEVIRIIRAAKTPNDAIAGLIERFNLTEIQSRAIVEMRLRQLTGLMQDQLHAEYEEIMKQIAYLESILADDEVCRQVMKDELLEVKTKYGDERRSEIVYSSEEFNPEDFYADDQMIITISHMGYIKRTPLTEFRAQNRGGVGSKGTETRDEDFVEHIYPATMHNTMMFFTQKGKCYWLKVYEIPEGTKNSKGRAIQNLLNIDSDDNVTAYLRVKSLEDSEFINSHYVLFCTKKGVIKKTLLEQYSRPRQNGVNAITIREDDSVIEVRMTNGNNEIIIANRNGRAIRFHEAAVRVMGRTATGVRGITLDNDGQDEVVGMICIKDLETESVMVVSEQGYGKRSEIEDYRKTNRGGKGVKTMNITEKTGKLVTIKSVTDENDLMIINKSGITIRLKVADVRIMGRATQGVRLINLEKRNDQIGSVCKVMTESLEDEIPAEEAEGTIVSDPNADVPDIDDAADVNENESNNEIEE